MELCIERGKPVKDIQQEFNALYPFLKIELTNKKQPIKLVTGDKFAGTDQHIDITGTRTVAQLENDFLRYLELPIQVFRRGGNMWIETSLTDDWTLDQQNKEGELFSNLHSDFSKK